VGDAKVRLLAGRMAALGIREADLTEKFILGSGPGGQKVNKTSSCVYLAHRPTGIEVKCQRSRSRAANRFFARRELCERLAARLLGEKTLRDRQAAKIRRQKHRRSRRQKERMLADKRRRSETKASRMAVRDFDA
jgi:protein subunit release factor B